MQKSYGQKKVILMFLLPAFIVYTLFVVVSVIWAGYYSLFDWSGVEGGDHVVFFFAFDD